MLNGLVWIKLGGGTVATRCVLLDQWSNIRMRIDVIARIGKKNGLSGIRVTKSFYGLKNNLATHVTQQIEFHSHIQGRELMKRAFLCSLWLKLFMVGPVIRKIKLNI